MPDNFFTDDLNEIFSIIASTSSPSFSSRYSPCDHEDLSVSDLDGYEFMKYLFRPLFSDKPVNLKNNPTTGKILYKLLKNSSTKFVSGYNLLEDVLMQKSDLRKKINFGEPMFHEVCYIFKFFDIKRPTKYTYRASRAKFIKKIQIHNRMVMQVKQQKQEVIDSGEKTCCIPFCGYSREDGEESDGEINVCDDDEDENTDEMRELYKICPNNHHIHRGCFYRILDKMFDDNDDSYRTIESMTCPLCRNTETGEIINLYNDYLYHIDHDDETYNILGRTANVQQENENNGVMNWQNTRNMQQHHLTPLTVLSFSTLNLNETTSGTNHAITPILPPTDNDV